MLTIVATPIGNLNDISLRARSLLENCDILIGEETRIASTLLKKLGLPQKEIFELNEHTKKNDLLELVDFCRNQNVVLISDCGTPVFSDPGSDLIAQCRRNKILVTTAPGASSLMALISLSSQPLKQFNFLGFLPVKKEDRANELAQLKKEKGAWILMDTPYRLKGTLQELAQEFPGERALLGINLTQQDELVLEGTFKEILRDCVIEKGEFIILKYGKS